MKALKLFSFIFIIVIFVYPAVLSNDENAVDLIFSHRFHVDGQEFECINCHPSIETSSSALDDNLPTMEECSSCHDVEDDESCGVCHKNPDDPLAVERQERDYLFNHQFHLEKEIDCQKCHDGINMSDNAGQHFIPKMSICFECHDGKKADNSCAKCHEGKITLTDIHPLDWKHQHGDKATSDLNYCLGCHQKSNFCLECHFGDNINGRIHDLNFEFTHGLEVNSQNLECAKCHERKIFCVSCHQSGNRMPLVHSTTMWPQKHGQAAKDDIENCASCHDTNDPTCAQASCHNDFDGILGTDPKIHKADQAVFNSEHGPWHNNDDYYCFQCHTNTKITGIGFCNYCHSGKGE